MDAFTSTSILPEVANGFGNNGTVDAVKYYISVPESGNARGFYMNTLKNMPFKGEQEILLPRGSQFKVIKSEASTMQRYGTEQSILKVFVELVAH